MLLQSYRPWWCRNATPLPTRTGGKPSACACSRAARREGQACLGNQHFCSQLLVVPQSWLVCTQQILKAPASFLPSRAAQTHECIQGRLQAPGGQDKIKKQINRCRTVWGQSHPGDLLNNNAVARLQLVARTCWKHLLCLSKGPSNIPLLLNAPRSRMCSPTAVPTRFLSERTLKIPKGMFSRVKLL